MTLKVRFWHYQVTKYNNLLEENHQGNFVKFGYSEKATKFEKIFHLKFDATQYSVMSNSKWKIFSNFVAF